MRLSVTYMHMIYFLTVSGKQNPGEKARKWSESGLRLV